MGRSADLATMLGLGAAVGVVGLAVALEGDSLGAFLNLPSFLIVVGGTAAATAVAFTWRELRAFPGALADAFLRPLSAPGSAALATLKMAEKARKEGILALQGQVRSAREPFLRSGLQLVVDGLDGDEIETILRQELAAAGARRAGAAAILRRAAEIAPAMGLIGTLIGLVQMLGKLGDPAHVGPAMAVALLTTLYGALLANLICAPLAAKLERNAGEETLVNTIYLTGLAAIGRQENPRRIETIVNSLLPEGQRLQFFA